MGQKTELPVALGSLLSANERLDDCDEYTDILVSIHSLLDEFESIDGTTKQQQHFTEQKTRNEHVRLVTDMTFFGKPEIPTDACFYVQHPESGQLLPVIKVMRCRQTYLVRLAGVSGFINFPVEIGPSQLCYVSDEPNVSGKTLDEVGERYANIDP